MMMRIQRHKTNMVRHPKGAALYMLVVFNAFLLGMLGLSALAVSRIERRQNQSGIDAIQAKRLATSGIRLAKLSLDQDKNWRTTYLHNVLTSSKALGTGSIQFSLKDLIDSDIANNSSDAISITSVGTYGDAVWSEEVLAEPIQGPPEFLKTSLHSAGDIYINSGAQIRMTSAPISSNNQLVQDGRLQANGECLSYSGLGLLAGIISTDQSPKSLPEDSVFNDFTAKALSLAYTGDMNGAVITAGVNTYGGGVHADGLYYINPGNNTLIIDGVRIEGTLLVDGDVEIRNAAYIKSASQNYPTLIVNGDLFLNLQSRTSHLRESDYSHNFNPMGAEYLGASDSDDLDQYPNQVEGLLHVRGNFSTASTSYLEGCVVCEGSCSLGGSFEIQHDISLYSNPPIGYEELPGPKMRLIPGSWKRVAAP